MGVTQVPIGLKKQAEGDPDWEVALNSGMDDANTRLTRSGTGDPNSAIPGNWAGQMYVQLVTPDEVQLWVCTNATGVAGTSTWHRAGVGWDPTNDRLQFWNASMNVLEYLGGKSRFFFFHNPVAGTSSSVLTASPTPTITLPLGVQTDEYRIFVLGWAQMTGASRKLCIQENAQAAGYFNVTADFPTLGSGKVTWAIYARNTHPSGAPAPKTFQYRLSSDAIDNDFCGMMVYAFSIFGGTLS